VRRQLHQDYSHGPPQREIAEAPEEGAAPAHSSLGQLSYCGSQRSVALALPIAAKKGSATRADP
jgi:hypothetical protein